MSEKNVLVVGGGPAGMMAAVAAAQKGHCVTLFERNEKLGKKLFITGKGRCNLTNDADIGDFFAQIPRNAKFLYSALYAFTNASLRACMEQQGVPTKVERGGRVFPASDKSSDVISALRRMLEQSGVQVRLGARVRELLTDRGAVSGVALYDGERVNGHAVILATGGAAYPATGSTGDGYRFAQKVGHAINPIMPSLVPLETVEPWVGSLQGLSLRNVTLKAFAGKRLVFEELGEMLFTHYGVSGPLVLSASSYLNAEQAAEGSLSIDLKPGLSVQKLDARLQRDFAQNGRKIFANALGGLLPARLIPVMVEVSGIAPDMPVSMITKMQRERFGAALKDVRLHVSRFRFIEEAIITRGGVCVKEVNPSTLQSKLVPGLYLAGELLDVDAVTGGFNLQIAFSTGYLAGSSVG